VSAFKDFGSDEERIRREIWPCGNGTLSGRIQIPKQASTTALDCLRSPAPVSAHFIDSEIQPGQNNAIRFARRPAKFEHDDDHAAA
jgi:hypothetical protein